MLVGCSCIVVGLPLSGRKDFILSEISKKEGIEKERLLQSADCLVVDLTQDIDELDYALLRHSRANPVELKRNYAIVENLDFFSQEKQEIFLKYLEDSSILFFFTAYDVNRIYSKALLSRVSVYHHEVLDVWKNLSKSQLSLFSGLQGDMPYKSISEMMVVLKFKRLVDTILSCEDSSAFTLVNSLVDEVVLYADFPNWFVVDRLYSYILFKLDIKIREHKILEKLFRVYCPASMCTVESFRSFLISCLLVIFSKKDE